MDRGSRPEEMVSEWSRQLMTLKRKREKKMFAGDAMCSRHRRRMSRIRMGQAQTAAAPRYGICQVGRLHRNNGHDANQAEIWTRPGR